MIERLHKNRLRPDIALSYRLRLEAEALIPYMSNVFRENGINDSSTTLVGSIASNFADDESDFDFLFDRRSHDLGDLVKFIIVTFRIVCPRAQVLTSHRIEPHVPLNRDFHLAFQEKERLEMAKTT